MSIQLIVYLAGILPALALMVWCFRKMTDISVMDILTLSVASILSWIIVVTFGIPCIMEMLKLDKVTIFKQKKQNK